MGGRKGSARLTGSCGAAGRGRAATWHSDGTQRRAAGCTGAEHLSGVRSRQLCTSTVPPRHGSALSHQRSTFPGLLPSTLHCHGSSLCCLGTVPTVGRALQWPPAVQQQRAQPLPAPPELLLHPGAQHPAMQARVLGQLAPPLLPRWSWRRPLVPPVPPLQVANRIACRKISGAFTHSILTWASGAWSVQAGTHKFGNGRPRNGQNCSWSHATMIVFGR